MATFSATYSVLQIRGEGGKVLPVLKGRGAEALADLTTSASSQIVQDPTTSPATDWSAPADGVVTMRADGDVRVEIAAAPTAVANSGFKLFSGERLDLAVLAGDKIAVIDA